MQHTLINAHPVNTVLVQGNTPPQRTLDRLTESVRATSFMASSLASDSAVESSISLVHNLCGTRPNDVTNVVKACLSATLSSVLLNGLLL